MTSRIVAAVAVCLTAVAAVPSTAQQADGAAAAPSAPSAPSAREQALARITPADAVQQTLEVDGRTRSYWLVAPALATPRPRPLLFVLHGGGTSDARVTFRYRFQDIAREEGFVTVHPNGSGAGWNDGRETAFLLGRGGAPDDVAFFRAMIARFIADGTADPKRIYVMGGSNGALMTLRLACELSGTIAGTAVVSGSLPTNFVDRCKPSRPIPMLMIAGTADDMMPFAGGAVAAATGQDRGTVIGAQLTFDFWRKANRCDPKRVTREDWPNKVSDDGTTLSVADGVRCAAPTQLMIVNGGGHPMPGTDGRTPARMQQDAGLGTAGGSVSREVDGPRYIWDFLRPLALTP